VPTPGSTPPPTATPGVLNDRPRRARGAHRPRSPGRPADRLTATGAPARPRTPPEERPPPPPYHGGEGHRHPAGAAGYGGVRRASAMSGGRTTARCAPAGRIGGATARRAAAVRPPAGCASAGASYPLFGASPPRETVPGYDLEDGTPRGHAPVTGPRSPPRPPTTAAQQRPRETSPGCSPHRPRPGVLRGRGAPVPDRRSRGSQGLLTLGAPSEGLPGPDGHAAHAALAGG